MSAESVNMDPDEFDAYFSGRAQPPGSWQSSLFMCEGLQVSEMPSPGYNHCRMQITSFLPAAEPAGQGVEHFLFFLQQQEPNLGSHNISFFFLKTTFSDREC